MIKPSSVPRLPVLDWKDFGLNFGRQVPSILDGADYIFASSGRAAIMLGLESLGLSKGDLVMVPTYHCPTMVAPIVAIGAEPIFYPIDDKGEALLQRVELGENRNIKAAIVPHFFGIPKNLASAREYCDQQRIALIEDCAHSFFGASGDRVVGHWGDIAIASLTKFFPVSSGGILVAPRSSLDEIALNSPGLLKELKAVVDVFETAAISGRLKGVAPLLRAVLSMKRVARSRPPSAAPGLHLSDVATPEALAFDVDLAHRVPEFICRVLPGVSDRRRIARCRRENYRKLSRKLSGYSGFSPLFPNLPDEAVPYVFPLRVENPDVKYHQLKRLGLPVFRWNWLWPGTPVIDGDSGLVWSSEVFQLACHQDLTEEELQCICATVISVCGQGEGARQ